MRYLATMANYNTWVNARIFELCANLNPTEYRKDRKAFFGSIHNTLNHILLVDILYLARLRGERVESIQALDQILHDDFEELRRARIAKDRDLTDYVDGLEQSDTARMVKYSRMDGSKCENAVEEVLITLFNHQTHHRGQIHTMLTQSGIANSEMPGLDVVDYLATRH